ncbi:AMP-binding protein [Oceanobacillus sp. 143]|nr:AMP-binding protein [Oceanobacillus sp. 143]
MCQIQLNLLSLSRKNNPQKVAILIGNEPAFLELYFAVLTLGWIAIPFDPKWRKRDIVKIMKTADPDLIIISEHFPESISNMFDKSYGIETLKEPSDNMIVRDWNHNDNAAFYLGFTSGSTGTPKGFIRNHKSWLTSFSVAEQIFQYNQEDIILAPGPLCHSLSLFAATHALHIGATLQLTETFKPMVLNDRKATVVYAVPTMIHGFIEQTVNPVQEKIVFLLSGAKLQPELRRRLQHVFPKSVVYEYFGASELSFISYASNDVTDWYPDSVGKPFPGVKVTIRDQEMKRVTNGEIGEVFIESDFLFTSYLHNSEETEKVLTDYGATVGDLGFINDAGILTIVGRKNI